MSRREGLPAQLSKAARRPAFVRPEEFKVSATTLTKATSDVARGSFRMRYPSELMQSSLGGTEVSFHGAVPAW